jgi:hypothetical protein
MHLSVSVYRSRFSRDERGLTLVLVLVLLGVLTVVGTTAVTLTSTDLLVGGNYKASQLAFYHAEAGVHYTLASVPGAIGATTLTLKGTTASENYTLTAPAGFTFTLNPTATFTRIATTRKYYFQVTGRPTATSQISSTIEVVIQRGTSLPYGIFGDVRVDLLPDGGVYSYDSRVTANPTAATSTHEADVGSNGVFDAKYNPHIDGSVELGDNGSGTEGTLTYTGTPTITGQAGLDVPRVNPDPLGASGGALAAAITAASTTNDNFPAISANTISLSAGDPPKNLGPGTYYLEAMTLEAGSTLNINATSGEVIIYLVGELNAQEESIINFNGPPTNISIFSNATDPITFKHLGSLKGTIYAPFATVNVKHQDPGALYPVTHGLVWGREVNMTVDFGGGAFYFDTALKDKFLANTVSLVSWKEIQN